MKKPLEVTITVGTSFSIGGAFSGPENYKPVGEKVVLCDGYGLDFMLDTFNAYNIDVSFFIEAAQYCYFGHEPMAAIARKIGSAGQDRQLLIHPCWFYFLDKDKYSQNDSCAERDYEELKYIFKKSIEVFEKWTGKFPDAIRTGNCQIDFQTYKIINELGIALSSSIGLGMFLPDGKDLLLYNGRKKIKGVMEVPLFTYQDKDIMGRYPTKTLQITSCSWPEMKYILTKARKAGIENIVLLSQPFDYIKKRDNQYNEITLNRVNQQRLSKLCAFINEYDQDFISVDIGSNVQIWKDVEQDNLSRFKIPTRYRNGRKIENFINNIFWQH